MKKFNSENTLLEVFLHVLFGAFVAMALFCLVFIAGCLIYGLGYFYPYSLAIYPLGFILHEIGRRAIQK